MELKNKETVVTVLKTYFICSENYQLPNGSEFWGFGLSVDLLGVVQWEDKANQGNRDSG